MFIEGCTNILATNFNPNAQINDGSCIFLSGCTMPFADNYNPDAVIDDGSCECSSYNLLLDFSGSTNGHEITFSNSGDTCITTLSFDYILKGTCEDILDVYLESQESDNPLTLTQILNGFELNFKLYENVNGNYEEFFTKNIWSFNFDQMPYDFSLDISGDFCEAFFDILRTENEIECNENIEANFNLKRNKTEIVLIDIENKPLLYTLQFKNFAAPHCIILDNIKLTRYCTSEIQECVLIPKKFGFDLIEEFDNIKGSVESNNLILNSKNINLRINPYNYVDNDIVSYFNNYGYFLKESKLIKISLDKINKEYIDVRRRQKTSTYVYHDFIYENYLNSMSSCGLKSKALDYEYAEEINNLIPPYWQDYATQLIPATARWNNGVYFYKNFAIHQNKHKYRNYTLDKGCDGDSTIDFEIITDNLCIKNLAYKSKFEQIAALNNICDQCGSTGVTYSYFDDGNNESGRLIQYSGDNMTGIVETVNFDSVSEVNCMSVDNCNIGIFISDVNNDEQVVTVDFHAQGASLADISIYFNNVKQSSSFISFDEETGQGLFIKEIGFGAYEILINVTTDCGEANDLVQYELCGGFFTNLPMTFIFDGNPNANGTIIGEMYGVVDGDINNIAASINGKPIDITSFDGTTFTIDFTLPWGVGINEVILTATTNCGIATIEGVINT